MIAIVDYGAGNLGSVANMFKRIGVATVTSNDPEVIVKADKLLLPGVGAFDTGMGSIEKLALKQVLDQKALIDKVPVLGICLGMQILTERSEEGNKPGLGWIKGGVHRFSFADNTMKVPHMGWNEVTVKQENSIIDIDAAEQRFYFVHSYCVTADNRDHVLGTTNYGYDFDSVITNGDNIFGAQFHPEKSHKFGMRIFENFAKL